MPLLIPLLRTLFGEMGLVKWVLVERNFGEKGGQFRQKFFEKAISDAKLHYFQKSGSKNVLFCEFDNKVFIQPREILY